MIINQREFESLGLYVSYFSRWKELAQKKDYEICSLSEVFQKIAEYDNKETLISVYAIIYHREKKDENNYILLLQDIRNSFKLNVSAEFYRENKENLVIHSELLFTLKVGVKLGKINNLICEKISNIK